MQNAIQDNQSLSKIEKNIIAEIKGKDLWGDIAVKEDEHGNRKERIKTLYENDNSKIKYT